MTLTQPVPLREDNYGAWFVGDTRVGLDVVIANYRRGLNAEQIVEELPTLELGDVYSILAYYIHNKAEVDAQLKSQERRAKEVQQQIESGEYFNSSKSQLITDSTRQDP
jgi:uncharacterized protein (DUF433 family)